jgi:hypothetical protein
MVSVPRRHLDFSPRFPCFSPPLISGNPSLPLRGVRGGVPADWFGLLCRGDVMGPFSIHIESTAGDDLGSHRTDLTFTLVADGCHGLSSGDTRGYAQ